MGNELESGAWLDADRIDQWNSISSIVITTKTRQYYANWEFLNDEIHLVILFIDQSIRTQ